MRESFLHIYFEIFSETQFSAAQQSSGAVENLNSGARRYPTETTIALDALVKARTAVSATSKPPITHPPP